MNLPVTLKKTVTWYLALFLGLGTFNPFLQGRVGYKGEVCANVFALGHLLGQGYMVPYKHDCHCLKLRILSPLGFCHCVLFVIEEYSYWLVYYVIVTSHLRGMYPV